MSSPGPASALGSTEHERGARHGGSPVDNQQRDEGQLAGGTGREAAHDVDQYQHSRDVQHVSDQHRGQRDPQPALVADAQGQHAGEQHDQYGPDSTDLRDHGAPDGIQLDRGEQPDQALGGGEGQHGAVERGGDLNDENATHDRAGAFQGPSSMPGATVPDGWYFVHDVASLRPASAVQVFALGDDLTVARDRGGSVIVRGTDGETRRTDVVAGAVFVWHGRGEPGYRLESTDQGPGWTPVRWATTGVVATSVANAMRDVIDNAHFEAVHGLRGAETTAVDAGHAIETVSQGAIRLSRIGLPPLLAHLRLDGRLDGPGLLVYRTTITCGTRIRNVLLSAITPLDGGTARFAVGVSVRRVPGLSWLIVRTALRGLLRDYDADARYWAAGRPRPEGAGPLRDDERALHALYDAWLARALPAAATL